MNGTSQLLAASFFFLCNLTIDFYPSQFRSASLIPVLPAPTATMQNRSIVGQYGRGHSTNQRKSSVDRSTLQKILHSVRSAKIWKGAKAPSHWLVKSPPQHIVEMALPRLIDSTHPPGNSARKLLVAPPHRDDFLKRTDAQDYKYPLWLFHSSTNVQFCLAQAVDLCKEDLPRAADELIVITHWVVTYLHQLGSPSPYRPNSRTKSLQCSTT